MRMRHAAIAALCCASLAACSQKEAPPGVTAQHYKKPLAAVRKGLSVQEQTAGMVVAPTLGKSMLPADLKFELGARPVIGQPLEISLALLPNVDGGPASVEPSASDGLDAVQGEGEVQIPAVTAGEVYKSTLHVMPTAEGVLLLNLKVSLKHEETLDSQVFTLPVIVDR